MSLPLKWDTNGETNDPRDKVNNNKESCAECQEAKLEANNGATEKWYPSGLQDAKRGVGEMPSVETPR
ncbi:hypothetical protein K0M31_017395, partial [Melipona bicolor]